MAWRSTSGLQGVFNQLISLVANARRASFRPYWSASFSRKVAQKSRNEVAKVAQQLQAAWPEFLIGNLAHGEPAELTRSPPRLRDPGLQSWASMAAFSAFANRGQAQSPDRLEPLDALEFA
jgi:tRNA A37 threonylcarbamoyladenosine modification protein TsaB